MLLYLSDGAGHTRRRFDLVISEFEHPAKDLADLDVGTDDSSATVHRHPSIAPAIPISQRLVSA